MTILVDADACPVKDEIERIGQKYQLPVLMIIDTSHLLNPSYAQVLTVSQAPDAVDLALINRTRSGDIVVTQDYGVAALALGKGAYAIHPGGRLYTNDNIEQMLFERHLSKKQRRQGKYFGRAQKRTSSDNLYFANAFDQLCQQACHNQTR